MPRYLDETIESFAARKFVLLAGPRQVGKTTAAKEWLARHSGTYLNWDSAEDRSAILKKDFLASTRASAVLLDEIHKYPRWKNYLKGLFDKDRERLRVVVTGSARLDLYRRGGDSMLGRYEMFRLHPFSLGELVHGRACPPPNDWLNIESKHEYSEVWERLRKFGGFPEPYATQDPLQYQRWSLRRRELLIREDLRDLSGIKLTQLVEHLYLLLPERVGSPLSVNGLSEELQVAYNTTASWISTLERLYICYRLSPFHGRIARSLKKEQKLYLWDWSAVTDPGAQFENMVAGHLLKSVHLWTDLGYGEFDLWYWRDKEKREIDFIITKARKPVVMVECKLSESSVPKHFGEVAKALGGVPSILLTDSAGVDYRVGNSRVVSACRYLAAFS